MHALLTSILGHVESEKKNYDAVMWGNSRKKKIISRGQNIVKIYGQENIHGEREKGKEFTEECSVRI
jgi:hypothetical protein